MEDPLSSGDLAGPIPVDLGSQGEREGRSQAETSARELEDELRRLRGG